MVGDPNRDKLVVGKTKAQIQKKFGSLVLPTNTSSYFMSCYQNSSWKDKDALFIDKSPWMVVFDGDRATTLVLMKAC